MAPPTADTQSVPRVSIGLPVFNGENYLEETVDSILQQTFTDFELIICDNASTDRTEEICRAYVARDPRVRYHRQPRNLGACANYDMTFHLSRGAYFKWAAHDDTLARTYLERTVAALDKDENCVLVHSRSMLIKANGRHNQCFLDHIESRSDEPAERLERWLMAIRRNNCPIFGVMRREVVAQTALHGDYLASDMVFLAAMVLQGRCRILPPVLFFHRLHPERSGMANPKKRDLMTWYTGRKTRLPLVKNWRLAVGLFDAAKRAPLTPGQRRAVHRVIRRWMWRNRKILALELLLPLYLDGSYTALGRRLFGEQPKELEVRLILGRNATRRRPKPAP